MVSTSYFLVLMAVFLSPFIGLFIGYLAREELTPGKKYLNIFKLVLVILLMIAFFVFFPQLPINLLILVILLLMLINKKYQGDPLVYAVFGVVQYLSLISINLFYITSSILFLYGLPCGSLLFEKHKKIKKALFKEMLLTYGWYLLVSLIFLSF